MTEPHETVLVHRTDDGVLLLGSESALAELDDRSEAPAPRLSPAQLALASQALAGAAGQVQARSGVWLKLSEESTKELFRNLDKFQGTGVLRGESGKIFSHLQFQNMTKVGVLTPAAPAVLASIATQYALQSALDEITTYLESISDKLDKLLEQRRDDAVANLGAVTLEIHEACRIQESTGHLSSVTWSKVQGLSFELKKVQAAALTQLAHMVEDVAAATKDTDKLAKVLREGEVDAQFWLGVLGRTIALQDRASILELARVADERPAELESHRLGIQAARRERSEQLTSLLTSLRGTVDSAARLSNASRVANPLSAPKVEARALALGEEVTTFARYAELRLEAPGADGTKTWRGAVKGLAGEAKAGVASAGSAVAGKVQSVGAAARDHRDERVLRKARKIQERRDGSQDA